MMKPWSREVLVVASFVHSTIWSIRLLNTIYIGCSCIAMASLSSDFRKLPIFSGTYLVNVSMRHYLPIFWSQPKTVSGMRLTKPTTCLVLSSTWGWVVKRWSIAHSKCVCYTRIGCGTAVSWSRSRTGLSRRCWMSWTNEGRDTSYTLLSSLSMIDRSAYSWNSVHFRHKPFRRHEMFLRPTCSIVRQERNTMLPPAAVSGFSILWFFSCTNPEFPNLASHIFSLCRRLQLPSML